MPTIFIRKIPGITRKKELESFVDSAFKGPLGLTLLRKPRIVKAEIVTILDRDLGTVEHHGIVTLDSEKSARRAIKRLNKRCLNGRKVLVRQFHQRNWHNDRRDPGRMPVDLLHDRRKGDRRRKNIELRYDRPQHITGLKAFAQKQF